MQESNATTPSSAPAAPLPLPTVSAWSEAAPPAMQPPASGAPASPRGVEAFPLLWFGIVLAAQVGFAVIFAYLVFSLGQRMDHQDEALDGKITRVIEQMDKEAREQAAIKSEQTVRKDLVARIPGLLDAATTIDRLLAEHGALTKLTAVESQAHRVLIENMRRDLEALDRRVNDLTYVRQPKIPIEGP